MNRIFLTMWNQHSTFSTVQRYAFFEQSPNGMRINLVRWKTIKTITVGCVSEKQIAKCQHFSLLLQSDWNGQIPIPWRGSNIFLTWQEIFPRIAAKFPWRMKDEDCGWEFPFSCVNVKSFHRMEENCECAGKCAFRRNAPTTPPLLLNSSFLTNYLMEVSTQNHANVCAEIKSLYICSRIVRWIAFKCLKPPLLCLCSRRAFTHGESLVDKEDGRVKRQA